MSHHRAVQHPASRLFARSVIACAAGRLALASTAGLLAAAPLAVQAQAATARHYDIPAGSLEEVLARFGSASGILLSFGPELTQGQRSPGLRGSHSVEAGLAALLANTGLQAVRQPNGSYLLRKAQVPTVSAPATQTAAAALPQVTISANSIDAGATAGGFLSLAKPNVGPWEGRSLQDIPYSVSVMTSEQAENTIARDFDQLYKMNPVVQTNAPNTVFGYPSVKIRGFDHSTGIVDGVRLSSYSYGLSTEETERVEVMNGLSGFLYGAGNVGGVANYVLKRPTYKRLTNATLGNYGGQQWFGHVDLGNRIDEDGKVAYRFNAMTSGGETAKDDQHMKKRLLSGALDFNVTNDLLLQLEAAHTYWRIDRVDSRFYSGGIDYWPDAFDVSKTYTPGWTYNETESNRIGANVRYTINDALTLRSAYLHKKDRREFIITYPIFTPTGWTMYAPSKTAPYDTISQGAHAYLDAVFQTGAVSHKLTFGGSWDGYKEDKHVKSNIAATGYVTPTNLTLDQFLNLETPSFGSDYGARYTSSRQSNSNIVIGDDITFTDRLSALVGLNYASLETRAYGTDGQLSSRYKASALTPTLSLIYKPADRLTTYASYMESLESGGVVADDPTLYTNPGAILDAVISKQYEIGAKYALSPDLLLSSALFRIEKSNTYNQTEVDGRITVTQDGLQVHQGLELTLAGRLTKRLNISAGATFMDLGIDKATNPALKGKKPIGSSSTLAKASLQYAVPGIDGLVLSGGIYYSGKKYKDSANLQKIDGYTLFDLGASYRTRLANRPTVFNLYVSNVTNKNYWSSYWQLGLPRTISFSLKTEF